ncbi:HDIG domain-containing metalloprotein [Desulfovibrio inopinatus]|uniref:HDIG domain-containing metalloprotein n=1 Tax=Desulfovibrio inopinatus TaxID=102109 RepID=UPI000418E901|nr:HDIG domain-containing metalloprotein [Desulfovibrio inopinatus]
MSKDPLHISTPCSPPLSSLAATRLDPIPSDAQCEALWEEFNMLDNIRSHSRLVAEVATNLALLGKEIGLALNVQEVRACGLLHDIAKTYTIHHGGSHSQLGASWICELTCNPRLSQGIVHHVYWPYRIDVRAHFLPMAIIYCDKRVKHDSVVSLQERFDDLVARYGKTPYIQSRIRHSFDQAEEIESALSQLLGIDLHAHTFDSGRMVD